MSARPPLIFGAILVLTAAALGSMIWQKHRGLDDPALLVKIAKADIAARARFLETGDLDKTLKGSPLAPHFEQSFRRSEDDLQWERKANEFPPRVQARTVSSTVSGNNSIASVELQSDVTITQRKGPIQPESIETYIVHFAKRSGTWQVTEVRNPSEFNSKG
jgi:hypothetical protein